MSAAVLFVFTLGISAQEDAAADAVDLFNRGQDAHEKGDLAEAIRNYENALKLLPEFPEAEVQRANAFVSLGRLDDAETAFRRAVDFREDWSLALAGLGSVLVQNKKYDEAEAALEKAIELDSMNFPAYAALAELRLRTSAGPEIYGKLLSVITEISKKANPPASIWAARAALENALGSRAAAKVSAANALVLDPNNVTALAGSADISIHENDPAGAEKHLSRLEAIAPNSPEVRMLRARLLVSQGRLDAAIKVLDSSPELGPEAAKLRAAIKLGSSTDPGELKKQLENDPKNAVVLGRLCTMLRTSEPEAAMRYCRQASELEPDNVGHAVGFASALLQTKRYEDAVSVLSRLADHVPDNATVRANLATGLFQLGRFADAKRQYLWLIERQPELAGAYYFLAITHDRLGEFPDAMANYQQFLRLADPDANRLEIEKVNLRLPSLQRQVRNFKGRKK